uniref:Pentraxin family member n=1 Tax=Poecilia latipinna TaxID=48699 RepID=A0A3B3U3W6_9TELE
ISKPFEKQMVKLCPASSMFTFPQETNTAHVRLTSSQNLQAVTVCLRFFTDLKRDYSLFSLALPSFDNDFLLLKSANLDSFQMYLNAWHSVCSTWDSESGLGQLWFDGKPSVRRFITDQSTTCCPWTGIFTILTKNEKDQKFYGGKFDIKQSFVGMMTDVHMWDYVLSSCEIQNYVDNLNFSPGNVLNWKALTFEITGRVLIENKQLTCH